MKTKDLLLLTYFRKNAREKLTSIAKKTSIPISTIFDKLKSYKKNVFIKQATIIDFKKLGLNLRINLMLKIHKNNKKDFEKFLQNNLFINNAYKINNGFDYQIELIFHNMDQMQDFTDQLEYYNILDKQMNFILNDIKREDFLTKENHLKFF
jgi:DNA-binding Lrp family transcriptional regulator